MKNLIIAAAVAAFSLGAVAQTTAPATPMSTMPMAKKDSMMKSDMAASAPHKMKKAKKHSKAASAM